MISQRQPEPIRDQTGLWITANPARSLHVAPQLNLPTNKQPRLNRAVSGHRASRKIRFEKLPPPLEVSLGCYCRGPSAGSVGARRISGSFGSGRGGGTVIKLALLLLLLLLAAPRRHGGIIPGDEAPSMEKASETLHVEREWQRNCRCTGAPRAETGVRLRLAVHLLALLALLAAAAKRTRAPRSWPTVPVSARRLVMRGSSAAVCSWPGDEDEG